MKRPLARRTTGISSQRTLRLYRLLKVLEPRPATRTQLLRKMGVGTRTFYRDLDVLRQLGIQLTVRDQKYHLTGRDWPQRLRLPDPELTFADAISLAGGKTAAARKLQLLLAKFAH